MFRCKKALKSAWYGLDGGAETCFIDQCLKLFVCTIWTPWVVPLSFIASCYSERFCKNLMSWATRWPLVVRTKEDKKRNVLHWSQSFLSCHFSSGMSCGNSHQKARHASLPVMVDVPAGYPGMPVWLGLIRPYEGQTKTPEMDFEPSKMVMNRMHAHRKLWLLDISSVISNLSSVQWSMHS